MKKHINIRLFIVIGILIVGLSTFLIGKNVFSNKITTSINDVEEDEKLWPSTKKCNPKWYKSWAPLQNLSVTQSPSLYAANSNYLFSNSNVSSLKFELGANDAEGCNYDFKTNTNSITAYLFVDNDTVGTATCSGGGFYTYFKCESTNLNLSGKAIYGGSLMVGLTSSATDELKELTTIKGYFYSLVYSDSLKKTKTEYFDPFTGDNGTEKVDENNFKSTNPYNLKNYWSFDITLNDDSFFSKKINSINDSEMSEYLKDNFDFHIVKCKSKDNCDFDKKYYADSDFDTPKFTYSSSNKKIIVDFSSINFSESMYGYYRVVITPITNKYFGSEIGLFGTSTIIADANTKTYDFSIDDRYYVFETSNTSGTGYDSYLYDTKETINENHTITVYKYATENGVNTVHFKDVYTDPYAIQNVYDGSSNDSAVKFKYCYGLSYSECYDDSIEAVTKDNLDALTLDEFNQLYTVRDLGTTYLTLSEITNFTYSSYGASGGASKIDSVLYPNDGQILLINSSKQNICSINTTTDADDNSTTEYGVWSENTCVSSSSVTPSSTLSTSLVNVTTNADGSFKNYSFSLYLTYTSVTIKSKVKQDITNYSGGEFNYTYKFYGLTEAEIKKAIQKLTINYIGVAGEEETSDDGVQVYAYKNNSTFNDDPNSFLHFSTSYNNSDFKPCVVTNSSSIKSTDENGEPLKYGYITFKIKYFDYRLKISVGKSDSVIGDLDKRVGIYNAYFDFSSDSHEFKTSQKSTIKFQINNGDNDYYVQSRVNNIEFESTDEQEYPQSNDTSLNVWSISMFRFEGQTPISISGKYIDSTTYNVYSRLVELTKDKNNKDIWNYYDNINVSLDITGRKSTGTNSYIYYAKVTETPENESICLKHNDDGDCTVIRRCKTYSSSGCTESGSEITLKINEDITFTSNDGIIDSEYVDENLAKYINNIMVYENDASTGLQKPVYNKFKDTKNNKIITIDYIINYYDNNYEDSTGSGRHVASDPMIYYSVEGDSTYFDDYSTLIKKSTACIATNQTDCLYHFGGHTYMDPLSSDDFSTKYPEIYAAFVKYGVSLSLDEYNEYIDENKRTDLSKLVIKDIYKKIEGSVSSRSAVDSNELQCQFGTTLFKDNTNPFASDGTEKTFANTCINNSVITAETLASIEDMNFDPVFDKCYNSNSYINSSNDNSITIQTYDSEVSNACANATDKDACINMFNSCVVDGIEDVISDYSIISKDISIGFSNVISVNKKVFNETEEFVGTYDTDGTILSYELPTKYNVTSDFSYVKNSSSGNLDYVYMLYPNTEAVTRNINPIANGAYYVYIGAGSKAGVGYYNSKETSIIPSTHYPEYINRNIHQTQIFYGDFKYSPSFTDITLSNGSNSYAKVYYNTKSLVSLTVDKNDIDDLGNNALCDNSIKNAKCDNDNKIFVLQRCDSSYENCEDVDDSEYQVTIEDGYEYVIKFKNYDSDFNLLKPDYYNLIYNFARSYINSAGDTVTSQTSSVTYNLDLTHKYYEISFNDKNSIQDFARNISATRDVDTLFANINVSSYFLTNNGISSAVNSTNKSALILNYNSKSSYFVTETADICGTDYSCSLFFYTCNNSTCSTKTKINVSNNLSDSIPLNKSIYIGFIREGNDYEDDEKARVYTGLAVSFVDDSGNSCDLSSSDSHCNLHFDYNEELNSDTIVNGSYTLEYEYKEYNEDLAYDSVKITIGADQDEFSINENNVKVYNNNDGKGFFVEFPIYTKNIASRNFKNISINKIVKRTSANPTETIMYNSGKNLTSYYFDDVNNFDYCSGDSEYDGDNVLNCYSSQFATSETEYYVYRKLYLNQTLVDDILSDSSSAYYCTFYLSYGSNSEEVTLDLKQYLNWGLVSNYSSSISYYSETDIDTNVTSQIDITEYQDNSSVNGLYYGNGVTTEIEGQIYGAFSNSGVEVKFLVVPDGTTVNEKNITSVLKNNDLFDKYFDLSDYDFYSDGNEYFKITFKSDILNSNISLKTLKLVPYVVNDGTYNVSNDSYKFEIIGKYEKILFKNLKVYSEITDNDGNVSNINSSYEIIDDDKVYTLYKSPTVGVINTNVVARGFDSALDSSQLHINVLRASNNTTVNNYNNKVFEVTRNSNNNLVIRFKDVSSLETGELYRVDLTYGSSSEIRDSVYVKFNKDFVNIAFTNIETDPKYIYSNYEGDATISVTVQTYGIKGSTLNGVKYSSVNDVYNLILGNSSIANADGTSASYTAGKNASGKTIGKYTINGVTFIVVFDDISFVSDKNGGATTFTIPIIYTGSDDVDASGSYTFNSFVKYTDDGNASSTTVQDSVPFAIGDFVKSFELKDITTYSNSNDGMLYRNIYGYVSGYIYSPFTIQKEYFSYDVVDENNNSYKDYFDFTIDDSFEFKLEYLKYNKMINKLGNFKLIVKYSENEDYPATAEYEFNINKSYSEFTINNMHLNESNTLPKVYSDKVQYNGNSIKSAYIFSIKTETLDSNALKYESDFKARIYDQSNNLVYSDFDTDSVGTGNFKLYNKATSNNTYEIAIVPFKNSTGIYRIQLYLDNDSLDSMYVSNTLSFQIEENAYKLNLSDSSYIKTSKNILNNGNIYDYYGATIYAMFKPVDEEGAFCIPYASGIPDSNGSYCYSDTTEALSHLSLSIYKDGEYTKLDNVKFNVTTVNGSKMVVSEVYDTGKLDFNGTDYKLYYMINDLEYAYKDFDILHYEPVTNISVSYNGNIISNGGKLVGIKSSTGSYLSVSLTPSNATIGKSYTVSVADSSIASYSKGVLTLNKVGTTKVTVSTYEMDFTFDVNVVNGITSDVYTIEYGNPGVIFVKNMSSTSITVKTLLSNLKNVSSSYVIFDKDGNTVDKNYISSTNATTGMQLYSDGAYYKIYIKGNVRMKSQIDFYDATRIYKYTLKPETDELASDSYMINVMNVNDKNGVDFYDATKLYRFTIGKVSSI